MGDLRSELERDGYAKVEGLFSKSYIDKIRAAALLCLTRIPKEDPQRLQVRNGFPALLFWPKDLHDTMKSATNDLHPIVSKFLGPDVLQLNNQYYYRLPGDGDSFSWHQDISFRTPKEAFNQIEHNYLQTAIVVDKMDDLNGGIEFVPGSHKLGELPLVPRDGSEKGLRDFSRAGRSGRVVSAKPGDLLLWSVMVVHGSEKNDSDRPRSYLMNGFASAFSVHQNLLRHPFPYYSKGGRLV